MFFTWYIEQKVPRNSAPLKTGLYLLFNKIVEYKSATQQAINNGTVVWPIKFIFKINR